METNNDNEKFLSIEMFQEIKKENKRKNIIITLLIVLFFVSNAIWLYAWSLPVEETTASTTTRDVDQNSGDSGINNNSIIGGDK